MKNKSYFSVEKNVYKPTIGITIGDFNGIGPEIIMKVFQDRRMYTICTPIFYGSEDILNKYKNLLGIKSFIHHQLNNSSLNKDKLNIINCWLDTSKIEPGRVSAIAARCALLALNRSTEDLRSKMIDAVVTCPINKHSMQVENFGFIDHTEYYTQKFAKSESLMCMCSTEKNIKIGLVTTHIPLYKVSQLINKDILLDKVMLMQQCLKEDFDIPKPRIAILSLNPHAGENGLLGNEEEKVIKPLIIALKKRGYFLYGPFSSDGFFSRKEYQRYDGILAMYHDQGLIPFKSLTSGEGVNYTVGLSIVRTSCVHGVAYDIAGKGIANESSLRESIFLACDIVKRRKSRKINKG